MAPILPRVSGKEGVAKKEKRDREETKGKKDKGKGKDQAFFMKTFFYTAWSLEKPWIICNSLMRQGYFYHVVLGGKTLLL